MKIKLKKGKMYKMLKGGTWRYITLKDMQLNIYGPVHNPGPDESKIVLSCHPLEVIVDDKYVKEVSELEAILRFGKEET